MSVAELQKYTAVSKYSRYVEEKGRRETWEETAERYGGMLLEKYPHRARQIIRLQDEFIKPMRTLPSMRGMQFGGPPIVKHNARLYNCWGSYVDRLSFFGEAFYILLCGGGVGASVQEYHLRSLPDFSKARLVGRSLPKKVFKPDDSIEGWADCGHVLMTSYHERPVPGFEEWLDCDVKFDLSGIRKKGALLSYGVGRAPGPMPLAKACYRNKELLNQALVAGLVRLNDELASDIHLNNSDAVVSGGVRRSANIIIFDLWSRLMRAYKTGNWFETQPQRARANISAMLVRGKVDWDAFWELFGSTKEFGEPGFWWADDEDFITNPCAEIMFYCRLLLGKEDPELARLLAKYDGPLVDVDGKVGLSGWQACNLTTQNGRLIKTPEDFYEVADAAAELGTYQAGFTDFPYLGPVTEGIIRKEALLGVSIAGVMQNPDVMLKREVLVEAAGRVRSRNGETAAAIGINPFARGACIKPDGNSSSTMGSFSGSGGGKIREGFRIAQANKQERPYLLFKSVNPLACEPSAWSKNGTDDVIRFCVNYEGVLEDDMTALEYLGHIRTLQKYWVGSGTVPERCVRPGLHHNVSCTVKVRSHEWEGVAKTIFEHQKEYGGVSFISEFGDRDYVQAPYTPVFTPSELRSMYGQGAAAGVTLGSQFLHTPSYVLWNYADIALGLRGDDPEAGTFLESLREMADRYFEGDLRKAIYATKDGYNHVLHQVIKESYRTVDYTLMSGENDVNFAGEVACAGGACEF